MSTFEISSEQTLKLTELREVLSETLPGNGKRPQEFPVAYSGCGCGCTGSYYVTCETGCYFGCSSWCAETCHNSCAIACTSACSLTEFL